MSTSAARRAEATAARPPTSLTVVRQVVLREYTTRVVTKAFVLSTLIMFVVIVGGLVAVSVFQDQISDETATIGVVGDSGALGEVLVQTGEQTGRAVELREVADAEAARDEVADGSVDAAVLAGSDGGFTAVSEGELSDRLLSTISSSVRQVALAEALEEQGVDPTELAAQLTAADLQTEELDPPEPDSDQRTTIAYVAVLLLFFSVFVYGLYVAMGVVEEKSSRVVELLLSTITPLQLLTGKVIGIGAVGLTQLLVLGGGGLVTALATGLLTIGGTAISLFVLTLVWYVLGFTFFALLYAAAGSLVSRQEDINAVASPLNLVVFGAYFLAQFFLLNPDNAFAAVLAWIPPFSAYLMPLRIAQGLASPLQVVATIVLMVAACALAAVVAARIYRRSVLNTGARSGWREALRRG